MKKTAWGDTQAHKPAVSRTWSYSGFITVQKLSAFINTILLLSTDDTRNIIHHQVAKSAMVFYLLEMLKLQKN